jgi:hypothetical protein
MLDGIDKHPLREETLLVVTSPRGYPLGEHRRVGPCDNALYGELLHVPLLIQSPDPAHAPIRSRQVIQPREVYSLIGEACGWRSSGEERASVIWRELQSDLPPMANVACAVGPAQRAIRTPAWFLREEATDDEPRRELFAKPDDRWEANEVSSRCTDITELLAAQLDHFKAAAREGRLSESPPLAEPLYDIWR